ncbi:Uncharacterised protein [Delftia tsuruhatensis]|uniref:DUF4124 domain-containing protein n=1 Tax=Delftia tsuruhatensis TaxID=180282 RepID=UPI001E6E1B95|nr:Uncharacterised protein [Delftia tsuruhatensis]CAC9676134.1 Uncharacterised protein [Delftia tsuruhatensis]
MNRALHARLLWCAMVWAAAGPACALDAGLPAGIYACTDAKGRRLTADRPIAECVDRDQRVLGSSGVELRRVGPSLTENERAELDAQRRRDQAEQRRVREERSRERALIMRYPNQAAHDAERAEAIAQVDQVVAVARQRQQDLQTARTALNAEMEFYRKDPAKAPASLRRQVDENTASQEEQQRFILQQDQEKRRIHERFDAELAQLRPLWAANARR